MLFRVSSSWPVAYFAAAWLGKRVKLDALAKHVAKVSRRMFEVPESFYYAIANGRRLRQTHLKPILPLEGS